MRFQTLKEARETLPGLSLETFMFHIGINTILECQSLESFDGRAHHGRVLAWAAMKKVLLEVS